MGNMDGFINKYPPHLDDPYKGKGDYKPLKRIVNNSGKLFTPQQGPKSKPQTSVINQNVAIKVNAKTFKTASNYATYKLNAVSAH
jgi:hypothetical protein